MAKAKNPNTIQTKMYKTQPTKLTNEQTGTNP